MDWRRLVDPDDSGCLGCLGAVVLAVVVPVVVLVLWAFVAGPPVVMFLEDVDGLNLPIWVKGIIVYAAAGTVMAVFSVLRRGGRRDR